MAEAGPATDSRISAGSERLIGQSTKEWTYAFVATAWFVIINGGALAVYRVFGPRPPLLWTIALLPYPLTTLGIWILRRRAPPWFRVGSLSQAVRRCRIFWLFLATLAIASFFARNEQHGHSALHYVQTLLVFGILDPIAEEFTFRGAVQTAIQNVNLATSERTKWPSIIISSAIFSLVHILNLLAGVTTMQLAFVIATAFPAGLLFGYLYHRTGNIWFGVLLHGLSNLIMP